MAPSRVNRVIGVFAMIDDGFAQLHSLLERFIIPAIFARAGSIENSARDPGPSTSAS